LDEKKEMKMVDERETWWVEKLVVPLVVQKADMMVV
jgi:hypothetical protein